MRAHTRVVEAGGDDSPTSQKKYPAVIIVNRSAFQLTLYKNLAPVKTYGIAVGQVGLETPAGLYNIQNKAVDPDWHVPNSAWAGDLAGTVVPGTDPSNPIKARWMGIYAGAGIHGTDADGSIGTAASHGCIRMRIPDVIELYDQVPDRGAGLHQLSAGRRPRRPAPGTPISSTGTSCHPRCSREAWWSVCRRTRVPMNTSRSCRRSTAYHMVEASRVPWIGCQGRGGEDAGSATPASTSCRSVAT